MSDADNGTQAGSATAPVLDTGTPDRHEPRALRDAAVERATSSRWVPVVQVVLVCALGAGLRLYRIGQQPLWLDEASSLQFAREPLARLWSWSALVDLGNPPLYYSLLHGWLAFGASEVSLRLLSAISGVATIPLVYAIGRTIRDHALGILGALLFAISPFQIWYSQAARGYALLTLGATSAMFGVAWILRFPERSTNPPWSRPGARPDRQGDEASRRSTPTGRSGWAWVAYVAGTAVALLAHDTAVFLALAANGLMVGWWWAHRERLRGLMRNWVLAQLAVLALWASWLPGFTRQVIDGGAYAWIPRATLRRVVGGAFAVYGGPLRGWPRLLEAVVIVALGALGLWSWRRERRWIAFVVVVGLTAPLGELIVSSWRPIFLPRTLIWVAVPAHVAVAAGLRSLRPRAALVAALAAVVALSGWGLEVYYFHNDREAWDRVAAYVGRGLKRGDAIVFSEDFLRIPFDYYYRPPSTYSVPEIGLAGTLEDPPVVLQATRTRSRVWLIVSHPRPIADAVISSLAQAGRMAGVAQFTGVDVYLYEVGA